MKFKIGDRVAVYGAPCASEIVWAEDAYKRWVGVITTMYHPNDNLIGVRVDGKGIFMAFSGWVHPKQCRLLKKKERRRVLVGWHVNCGSPVRVQKSLIGGAPITGEEWVEFIEVKKK